MRKTEIYRSISLLCVLVLTASLFIGCSNNNEPAAESPSSSPTSSDGASEAPRERVKYTLMVEADEGISPDSKFYKYLEEKFNVDLEVTGLNEDAYNEKLRIMMATGTLPDIMVKVSRTLYAELARSGSVLALNDYKEHTPNFIQAMSGREEDYKFMNASDGKYYGLPILLSTSNKDTDGFMYMKQTFNELNLQAPKTTDELYDVLKKLKEAYPDSYPMTTYWPNAVGFSLQFMFGAYDKPFNVHAQTTEQYKEGLKFFNKLYKEKLLDPEYLTITEDVFRTKLKEKKAFISYGSIYHANRIAREMMNKSVEEWDAGLTDPAIKKQLLDEAYQIIDMAPNIAAPGRTYTLPPRSSTDGADFVFNKDIKHPEVALQMADYFYSKEGANFAAFGVEGVHFEANGDDIQILKPVEESDGDNFMPASERGVYSAVRLPIVIGKQNLYAGRVLEVNGGVDTPTEPWAFYNRTEEQDNRFAQLNSQVYTKVAEYQDKFITGALDVDKDWDKYMDDLNNSGLKEMIEIQEATVIK